MFAVLFDKTKGENKFINSSIVNQSLNELGITLALLFCYYLLFCFLCFLYFGYSPKTIPQGARTFTYSLFKTYISLFLK